MDQAQEHKLDCLARWIANDRCQGKRELVGPYFDALAGKRPWKETGQREAKPIGKVQGLREKVESVFDEMEAQAGKSGKKRRGREFGQEFEIG